MATAPGALCTTRVGRHHVDDGTCARTRMPAPANRHAAPRHVAPRHTTPPLDPREAQVATALRAAGVTNANEVAMMMGQLAHESNGFRRTRENLRYSAERLLAVFPSHFADLADAQAVVVGGRDAIAERIYGGRADLGNTTAGDGARFVGRGFIQITGRANYAAAGSALGLDLVNHPELAEDRANAARIAVWFWNAHHAGPPARLGNVPEVTRIVNGGQIGLADRTRRFRRYQAVMPPPTPVPEAGPALRLPLP